MVGIAPTSIKLFCEQNVAHIGANANIAYYTHTSDLGYLLVAKTDKGLCYVGFADSPEEGILDMQKRFPYSSFTASEDSELVQVAKAIAVGKPLDTTLTLHVRGTDFQTKVWQALLQIPAGKRSNYSEIASRIDQAKAVRAVGTAIGANPIAVLIPCHRVLRSDGQLGGYHWGLARKRALLQREGAI